MIEKFAVLFCGGRVETVWTRDDTFIFSTRVTLRFLLGGATLVVANARAIRPADDDAPAPAIDAAVRRRPHAVAEAGARDVDDARRDRRGAEGGRRR